MLDLKIVGKGYAADVYDYSDNEVLKLFHNFIPLESIDLEYNTTLSIQDINVRIPKAISKIEIDGKTGIIYEKVKGMTIAELLKKRPWLIIKEARKFAELHVALHKCKFSGFISQKTRIKDYILNKNLLLEEKENFLNRLDTLPEGNAICHNDYNIRNVMVDESDAFIIDWEGTTIGDPASDIAITIFRYKISYNDVKYSLKKYFKIIYWNIFYWQYLKHYIKLSNLTYTQISIWISFLEYVNFI